MKYDMYNIGCMFTGYAFHYLMYLYRKKRRFKAGVLHHATQLSSLRPESAKWSAISAQCLYEGGQYEEALKAVFNTYDIVGKYDDQLMSLRVRTLMKLGRGNEAVSIVMDEISPGNRGSSLLYVSGRILLDSGKLSESLDYYRFAFEASETDNQKSKSLHAMGYVSELMGDRQDAKSFYDDAVRLSSSEFTKALGVGYLHQRAGWKDAALKAYLNRVKEGYRDPELFFRLGNIYSGMGDEAAAAEYYEQFVNEDILTRPEPIGVDGKLIVFDAFMGRRFVDSPKVIYKKILKDKRFKGYRFIWMLKGSSWRRYWMLYLNPRTKVIKYRSREYYLAYRTAKYWVTNSRLPFIKKASEDQVYIQCWHGTPLKRLGFDIIPSTQSVHSVQESKRQYKAEADKIDFFISPSKFATEKFVSAFNIPNKGNTTMIESGYPRNDPLASKSSRPRLIAEKMRLGIPLGRKVLLYAPTWRDNTADGTRFIYKPGIDFNKLRESIGDEWVVLFRPHYVIADSFNFSKYKGFIVDASGVDDVNRLYEVSDALMTDYSSVFFDYANLKRPIIFYMYDLDYYRDQLRGFYLSLDELPGDIVEGQDEIPAILKNLDAYNRKHQRAYDTFNDKFNYLDDGRAADRVVSRIFFQ